jgi:superfamily II DNA or RNA helicase
VNRDFAKFLGYFLSKGSWNVGAVRFYSTDEAILKDYEQTVQHLFKLKTKCIPDKKNEKGITVAIYSRKLVAWLKEVVGSPNTSKKSHNITVPNCILSSSKPIVAEFLKAYFAGDGHINPERGVVEVGGGSEKIIREIQMLLLSHFGILSTFRSETSKIDGRKYTGYCLNLRSNSDIAKLVTQIGVFPNDKLKKALKMAKLRKTSKIEENGLLLVPIKKIYGSRSRVYDLTVEGTHSFIANGFVSHNTFIGLKAIETLKEPTIIIVPTLVLVDHWVERLKEKLNVDAGVIGGGKKEVKYVTVATYDSAYIYAEELGNKFSLMVLDEVHHALSPNFSLFLEMFVSPHRLGLTSTLHRPDLRHLDTPRLIGDVVYEATHEQLAGRYVSPFEYEKIFVDLTPEEKVVYEQQRKIYTDYLEKANLQLRTYEDFRRLIMRSGFDPEARAAVLARNLAFKIALNSVAKINFLAEQLKQVKEKTLIFTLHNDTVYQISKRFLVPAITHQTPEKERREILQKFKSGEYIAIVTSQVLDEGVDIPDASLGIILGGTGSPREYIQRLGRLLRKQEGKVAHLIEVVSRATSETGMSLRRHRRLQDAAE